VNTITLPVGLFWLIVGGAAVAAALLTAAVAERLSRVRYQARHAEYHRRGGPDRHSADAPFVSGAVHELHRQAAQLAARSAVQPIARPNPAALLHVRTDRTETR